MALKKQGFDILFGQGLDTKTDPNQVPAGKMLVLENSVFNNGLLEKRTGFPLLTSLPDANQTTLATLNNNLLATGTNLYAYSSATDEWLNQGIVQPVELSVLPLVRTSTSQTNVDSAISDSGLVCAVYDNANGSYYRISDSTTGQVIVQQTALPSTAALPRVFLLGRFFIITFLVNVTATPTLRYISIPVTQPSSPASPVTISSSTSGLDAGYDGVVANNNLYVAWNSADVGNSVKLRYLSSTLVQSSVVTLATEEADLMSVSADISGSTPVIWIAYWAASDEDGYVAAFNQNLVTVLVPTQIINAVEIAEITSVAADDICTVYYQNVNEYSFDTIRSDFITKIATTQAGVVGSSSVIRRSVGLASKAFMNSLGTHYMLAAYGETFQPSYFLLDGSGNILMRLAYSNGGGYADNQILASVSINDDRASLCYLVKDLLVAVNKSQGVANTAGIYSQTGINLATIDINTSQQQSIETAGSLHLTGGQVWQYDTIKPVELGFHVWPENLDISTATTGGFLTAQQYYYIACYEWTDAQGMLHRSAPSVPIGQITGGGDVSANTLNIPTLRLTAKTGDNPVRIVLYRWSTAQQTYYQITSITSPLLNSTTVDSVQYVDTQADSSILGNTILYTTGGVIENIAPPAASDITLTKSRAFLLNAENPNEVWFSKQLVQGVPLEFSDLLTLYISPSSGSQGSTGNTKCITVMDDKLIAFKANAINYVTGKGPDDTGANNDFSEPTFITAVAGCSNPNSIAFIPQGIMFQSDKGIWLLDRNLATTYIGADVEAYNDIPVTSTVNVPGTNQVRFNLADGTMLMYDYFYNQWGTFKGIAGISSTLHNGLHTYLDSFGKVKQQSINSYMDGSSPVLQKFTTAWLKINQLQGFQRAYSFSFLGKYFSPHKLLVEIAYDFDPAIKQSLIIEPDNYGNVFGGQTLYGGGENFGGLSSVEQWEVYLERQKTQSVQITVTEIYDSSFGVAPGAGFSMSGINILIGNKDTYPKIPAARSAG